MIRTASPLDQATILDIAVDSGLFAQEDLQAFGVLLAEQLPEAASDQHWLLLEEEGKAVAAAYYAPEPLTDGTYNLYFIAVREAEKGSGRGSALLSHVEAELRQRGARVLLIETSSLDGFRLTRSFYLKHGYSEEARIRDFYTEGEDKVVFWRKLNDR